MAIGTAHAPSSAKSMRVAYLLADVGIPLWDSKKGSSIHARSMIRAFVQEGCHVDVYVMRTGKGKTGKFHVRTVRQSRLTRWWWRKWVDGRGWWRRLWPGAGSNTPTPNWMTAVGWLLWHRDFYRTVARRGRRRQPDLVYARNAWFAWPYVKLKRRLGVPLILEVNAVMSLEKVDRGENAFDGLARRIERRMFQDADRILPVSAQLRDRILAFDVPADRIEVTPNAVDPNLFCPVANGPEHPAGQFVVGAVNSMRGYHGMGTLLRAAQRLKDRIPGLRVLLIGGGPLLREVEEEARRLGLTDRVEFTGVLDHIQVPVRLRECDVCVSPNEGEVNQYNCPMKLFEYMSMNIPIVASRWGDIPNHVIDGETGLLHEPGDPESLANAIEAVWRDPEAARRRAEAARAIAEQHTWRATARRVLDFVNSCHARRGD